MRNYVHISHWDFKETAVCPECNELTHPEYLKITKLGYVIGCSLCITSKGE